MPLSSTKCHNWIFFSTIWVVLQQHIWHKTITEQHGRLWDSLPTPPPQFPRDLRAAPTLPGLANPPLEGVRLARLSSVHRVKRSVCPKEPVNTSLSDLLHSTANVKPHYPPLNGVPDPTFTNGHKAWSPWSTVVCRLTPSPLTFNRPRKALSRTASGTKRKSYGTVFSNLLRSQPEKDPFWWKWTENAAKIKHRLQPCRSAQQSVIIEFSLALILSGFTTTYLTQDYNRATWPPVGLPPHPSPAVPQGPQSSSDPAWVSQPSTRGCPAS